MWAQTAAQGAKVTLEEVEELLTKYRAMREEIARFREEKTAKEKEFSDLEGKVIEAMQATGKSKVYVEGMGTAYFIDKLVVPTPKTNADKKAFFAWLEAEYGAEFLTEKLSVNHQTLQSLYNAAFEEFTEKKKDGIFSIPGLQEPTSLRSLGFRKEK